MDWGLPQACQESPLLWNVECGIVEVRAFQYMYKSRSYSYNTSKPDTKTTLGVLSYEK